MVLANQNKRRPRKTSSKPRMSKLYSVDDAYMMERVEAGEYKTISDAIREFAHIGCKRERGSKIDAKDSTAIAAQQQTAITENINRLVERMETLDRTLNDFGTDMRGSLDHTSEQTTRLETRLAELEKHASTNGINIRRLLEITVVIYGMIRHYVLGVFVVGRSKLSFAQYEQEFLKRIRLWSKSARENNVILDAPYEEIGRYAMPDEGATELERRGDIFAASLAHMSKIPNTAIDHQNAADTPHLPPDQPK